MRAIFGLQPEYFSNFHSSAAESILSHPKLILYYFTFLFLVTKYFYKFVNIFCTVKPCQWWYFYFSIDLFSLIFLAQSSESCAQESERALTQFLNLLYLRLFFILWFPLFPLNSFTNWLYIYQHLMDFHRCYYWNWPRILVFFRLQLLKTF